MYSCFGRLLSSDQSSGREPETHYYFDTYHARVHSPDNHPDEDSYWVQQKRKVSDKYIERNCNARKRQNQDQLNMDPDASSLWQQTKTSKFKI